MNDVSEVEQLDRARSGDRAALGQLLLAKYDDLSRMIAPKIPDQWQSTISVDDVLQQAFTEVYRNLDRFEHRGDGSFLAWLRTIAEHRLRDMIKAQAARKRGGDLGNPAAVGGNAEDSALDLVKLLTGGVTSPSRAMSRKEAVRALNAALSTLREDHAMVIRLRFLQEKSLQEAAEEMGRTPNAVRAMAHRAKQELREALGRLSNYMSDS